MARRDYARAFADSIIEDLQNGTAPWIRPWKPGEFSRPFNPVSGTVYKGINTIMLSREGHEDPRFMTLRQANGKGWKVRKGSKARSVIFWQFSKEERMLDDDGKPVLDENGKAKMQSVLLARPVVRFSSVFHASQIEGIPEWKQQKISWNPDERAEKILSGSGARILHSQRNRAFYSQRLDEIHLPSKSSFDQADKYYATALHELGHWTGHPSRLDRTFGPFGSEEYAKEELRAEIGSWMTGTELGLGHDPGQHLSYVQSWVKILKDEPYEIIRACRDAEKIKDYTMAFEKGKAVEQATAMTEKDASREQVQEHGVDIASGPSGNIAQEKTWLTVPYSDKGSAKKAGARWDCKEKCWFAPKGSDLSALANWIPKEMGQVRRESAASPLHEFAQALRDAGLDLKGELPVMDGQLRRVPLIDRPAQDKDGAYKGYLDGRPAGFIQNFSTGLKMNWKGTGHKLTDEQKAALQAEAAMKKTKREAELKEQHRRAAKRAYGIWMNSGEAKGEVHPYLKSKGVGSHGLKLSNNGDLLVPGKDEKGFLHTLQVISADGKRFLKGGRQTGTFHTIDPDNALSDPGNPVLIAEGYATAASLHEATKLPALMAFHASNLENVAKAIHRENPERPLAIMADNDHHLQENIGLIKAEKAAEAVNGIVIAPEFSPKEKAQGLKDFNDLHAVRGLREVRHQVQPLLRRIQSKRQRAERPMERTDDMAMTV